MKFLKFLINTAFMALLVGQLKAQSYTIKGHINDAQSGESLSGVNIITADTSAYTASKEDGSFELKTRSSKGILQFSSVGYKTLKIHFNQTDKDLNVRMEPQSATLNTIIVKSLNSFTRNKETPAAVSVLQGNMLHQDNSKSIQAALNSVPGIRMDQSGVAEGRLSIRGMGARSPWGIRKVRVYLNDIPLTGADGITSWDDVNVNALGRVEILRGPTSSIYGSGTIGGVINFEMKRAQYGEHSVGLSSLIGSYGLQRVSGTFKSGAERMSSYVSYGLQDLGGYRDHNNDRQRFLAGNFQFYPSGKQTISLLIYHASQFSELPGDLTLDEVKENRRQASSVSLEKNTRRNITRNRIGVNQKYKFNNRFSNSTSLYTYFMDFSEPLSYGINTNFTESIGGRTFFTLHPGFETLDTKFIVGAEVDNDRIKSILYDNVNGEGGDIWSNVNYKNTLYTVFYQSETHLFPKMMLTLGLSYSGLNYHVKDFLVEEDNGLKQFGPRLSPRLALSYNFNSALSLHGSLSTGYNPPNTEEISNVDNTINQNIMAEKAINYELDAKGSFLKNRLNYDLALFMMNMRGELIGQSPLQGVTIYRNSGKTRHEGGELSLAYQILRKNDQKFVVSLKPNLSVTYSHFRFEDFRILDKNNHLKADYRGNQIPGIGPWMVYLRADMETKWGLYFSGNYRFNDRYALNDANTYFNPSYRVVNTKAGYKTRLFNHFDLNVFVGINNLTNEFYSSFTEINAEGHGGASPAFFQPSPGINGYGGLKIKYNF